MKIFIYSCSYVNRYLFIEFETPEQANLAIKQYDGYPMDKTHYLALNRFTDIEKYSQIEEEYKEPEEEKFVEKVLIFFLKKKSFFSYRSDFKKKILIQRYSPFNFKSMTFVSQHSYIDQL